MISLLYRILSILTWQRTIARGPAAIERRLLRREGYRIVRALTRHL